MTPRRSTTKRAGMGNVHESSPLYFAISSGNVA